MSFYELVTHYQSCDIDSYCATITADQIDRILAKVQLSPLDFCALLSDAASDHLEAIAQKALRLTRCHFGNTIILFTPMYISNHCTNVCPYCSFAKQHAVIRSHLSVDEIGQEAAHIKKNGIRHILVLTGESPSMVPIDYLEEAIKEIKKHFASVTIEIYPLAQDGYACLLEAGADGLTLYQETYNERRYRELHPIGPKSDYRFRLDAPERAVAAGMRSVTVGALHGLTQWRSDAFLTGLHADYLQKKFPAVEVGISLPRLRPLTGTFTVNNPVTDRQLVQILCAMRCFLPTVGITMSTRESAAFRMGVLPLGVTRMSAGVSTSVGGHSCSDSTPQFEIADQRDVATICKDLLSAGFQPVMHDWNYSLCR